MQIAEGSDQASSFVDLGKYMLAGFWLLICAGLFYYYEPALLLKTDYYVSDLTYFFEPFCRFVREQAARGIFPLWNPYLYCGMPQMAMPSPGLFYPLSWTMFLLPFSCGISLYML
ncbi:MAG: hypothetical protein K2X27_07600, partial [Candidatus Obscuribacterales bacterium]|nr:hypothetical protein [Candidatus Obscuribacterales bacterium]